MLPRREPTAGRVQIGRYVVTGRIGRGGMGVVYRGVDEALEREVAIKTLIAEGDAQSESRQRFAVEAKAAARLQHPNIVIVYELSEDRGLPFMAMELLSGGDLEGVLRGGEPLGLVEKLDVLCQVCRGLAFAHERGIVHRDIKPSNIRLLDDGTAKIMDFGIAKLGSTQLTKAGMMVGTVHYMSPEQVRGRPLDGRSDVFSVGVILYELLAGQRPFRGDGTTQVLYRIVHEAPAPLELAALGAAGPSLAAIAERALAKDPADRYTAVELARALGDVLAELRRGEPAPAPAVAAALAEARELLRAARVDDAVSALGPLADEHPDLVEAQRLLRTALRRQKERGAPAPPVESVFPELEATFQATRTRHDPALAATAPTVALSGGEEANAGTAAAADAGQVPSSAAVASGPPARFGAGIWIGTAAALLALAVAAALVLVHGRRPPAHPRLAVRSQPSGASVLVDGRDSGVVTDGVVELPAPPPEQVELTFRKTGHRDETRTVRLPPGPEPLAVTLLPLAGKLFAIRTTPAGAALTLDGASVGQSPLELAIETSGEHRLVAALDGYEPSELRIAKGQQPAPLEMRLQKLAPAGTLAISSAYPLDVIFRGRTLARSETAPRVSLPGGRQTLTLVAPAVFLRSEIAVEVPSGGEASVAAPRTGKLNVRAAPDNCQVFVDGVFLDYPPILDRAIAAGRHVVGFRWPDGVRDQETIVVEAGSPAFVMGQKPKE